MSIKKDWTQECRWVRKTSKIMLSSGSCVHTSLSVFAACLFRYNVLSLVYLLYLLLLPWFLSPNKHTIRGRRTCLHSSSAGVGSEVTRLTLPPRSKEGQMWLRCSIPPHLRGVPGQETPCSPPASLSGLQVCEVAPVSVCFALFQTGDVCLRPKTPGRCCRTCVTLCSAQ